MFPRLFAFASFVMDRRLGRTQATDFSEYAATTINVGSARKIGVTVGAGCRLFSTSFSTEPYLITIGDHVTRRHRRSSLHHP